MKISNVREDVRANGEIQTETKGRCDMRLLGQRLKTKMYKIGFESCRA